MRFNLCILPLLLRAVDSARGVPLDRYDHKSEPKSNSSSSRSQYYTRTPSSVRLLLNGV